MSAFDDELDKNKSKEKERERERGEYTREMQRLVNLNLVTLRVRVRMQMNQACVEQSARTAAVVAITIYKAQQSRVAADVASLGDAGLRDELSC